MYNSETFSRFTSRKDRALTGFSATSPEDAKALLSAICSNAVTGYVRSSGASTFVPNHAADAIEKHLNSMGWTREKGEQAGAWYIGDPNEGSETLQPLSLAVVADAIGEAIEHKQWDSGEGYFAGTDWNGAPYIEHNGTRAALPFKTVDEYCEWRSARPHNERRSGSFSGDEYEKCAARRMASLWKLATGKVTRKRKAA